MNIQQTGLCWWCGETANSREHRHKKTDVKRIFLQDGLFDAVIGKDKRNILLQGPNSQGLKFDKIMCHGCNSTRSQPFDFAYDKFIEYVHINYDEIISEKMIDCKKIFGPDWKLQKQNLFRYYTKHFCCRIASNGISVSQGLLAFLNGQSPLRHLYLKFEVRMDLKKMIDLMSEDCGKDIGNLYLGGLTVYPNEKGSKYLSSVYTFYNYRWMRTMFFYSGKISSRNFPGYVHYNKCDIIPVECLYFVDPEKFKNCSFQEFLNEYSAKAQKNVSNRILMEQIFNNNPFKKFAKNKDSG